MSLKFADIDEWTPSSISIVDEPAHPLCHFEVYSDDEEYVKKSIQVNEGENMVEQDTKKETDMVSGPASFFEKIFNRTVAKADEVPQPPAPKAEEESGLEARVAKLERELAELKKEKEEENPTDDAVAKSESSEGEAEGEGEGEGEPETPEKPEEQEEQEVVTKSIDPDAIPSEPTTDKSLVERAGRKTNGMTW